jgi:RimJ/RimL family protein N-acetyltransferase
MKLLVTPRLILRPFSQDDLPVFSAITSDPLVMRNTSFGAPLTYDECRYSIEQMTTDLSRDGFGMFAVIERKSKKLIGSSGLRNPGADDGNETEIEFFFAREAWGSGYATESLTEVLRHAFVDLGLDHILAYVPTDDPAALRVLRKVGMRHVTNAQRNGADYAKYEKRNGLLGNISQTQNHFSAVRSPWLH